MLERTTGMYFCMLLASEEGRDLRVEQIPIVYHDFGSQSEQTDMDGKQYK